MARSLGECTVGDKYRIYIPPKVRKSLELKIKDELVFELDNNKIVIWKSIVTRDTIRKLNQPKK